MIGRTEGFLAAKAADHLRPAICRHSGRAPLLDRVGLKREQRILMDNTV